MASTLQQGAEEGRVSAMSAATLSLGELIASELVRRSLEQVYIKGGTGAVLLMSVGAESRVDCPDPARSQAGLDIPGNAARSR